MRAVTAPDHRFQQAREVRAAARRARRRPRRSSTATPSRLARPISRFEQEQTFKLGNALFRKLWVSSPSSTQSSDGLGPLFNARGCQNCHLKDGRGHPPENADEAAVSMFLRLSVPPEDAEQQTLLDSRGVLLFPEPTYGEQLQVFAVPGLKAEGKMVIDYADEPVTLGDGTRGDAAAAELFDQRSRLWADERQGDAVAARRAADDRARAARGYRAGGHSGAGRSGRCGRRRDFGAGRTG